MSLTSHLAEGELADWFAQRLSDPGGVRAVAARVDGALRGREPEGVAEGASEQYRELVEVAVTQRLAFAVEPAPPYYALLGAHVSDLADVARLHAAAKDFPTHNGLQPVVRIRGLDRRPTPAGWIDAADPEPTKSDHDELFGPMTLGSDPPTVRVPGHDGRCPGTVLSLCSWLSGALRFAAPPGQLADPTADGVGHFGPPTTENTLAAACVVLAAWEHAYRHREALPSSPLYDDAKQRDAEQLVRALLGAADPWAVAEVAEMTTLARDTGVLDELRDLARNASTRVHLGRLGPMPTGLGRLIPFGYARPVLVPHWADTAAVIGDAGTPGGTTLLTVQAPDTSPEPAQVLAWCHRLLALAWLDARDTYRVGNVAVYLARHGALVTWRADELTRSLAGLGERHGDDLALLREEFRVLARQAVMSDGADPRWFDVHARPNPNSSFHDGVVS